MEMRQTEYVCIKPVCCLSHDKIRMASRDREAILIVFRKIKIINLSQ